MKPRRMPTFMCIGTMVIELHVTELNYKNKKKNDVDFNNLDKRWEFSEIFGTQITFQQDLCCKVIQSQIDLKLKVRGEFPNVWREYTQKNIQGTTVPYGLAGPRLLAGVAPRRESN